MIELFFVLFYRVKKQLYEIMYSFSKCCGGPHGPAIYSKIRQIREGTVPLNSTNMGVVDKPQDAENESNLFILNFNCYTPNFYF
jgi:hypothetical protein